MTTTWRAEPVQTTPPPPPRADRRAGMVRALALAVAALLTANGVIVTEQVTGRDLIGLAFDGFGNVRSAIGRVLEPDSEKSTVAGAVEEQTSTTSTTLAPETTTTLAAVPVTAPAPTAPPTTSTTTPPTTAKAAAPAPSPLDQAIVAASAFVQKERGLRFTSPLKVTALDEGPFRDRLNAVRTVPAMERAKRDQPVLRALGVIPPNVDLPAQVKRLLSTGTVSVFYDAKANELLVRNGPVTPFVRKAIVHELARALDDQSFELDRPALANADDETGASFNALSEGVAKRIETRYVNSLPEADRKSVEAESRRLAAEVPRDLPPYVLVTYGYPYAAGPKLADALFGAGGAARVNAAFQGPPSTSEQVLHPEKFMAGEGAKPVPTPGSEGAVVRQGSLGQLTLSLMLAEVLEAGYAEGAADGWGGDRFVAWQNGANTCVRLVVDMDNPEENSELGDALADWALDRPGATVEGTGPFTVTRCG